MVAELEFWDPASTTVSVSAELFQFRQVHRQLRQNGPATTSRLTSKQSAEADTDDLTADPRAATASAGTASQQTQATARMAQAFQASMDQQLKIHQNVEKSIDVRDRSELKGIPKPDKFSGASGTWDSWYYKFKIWIESCHKNAIQVMQKLESTVDVAITEKSRWLPWGGRACFSSGSPGSDILDRRWSVGDRQEHLERNPFWVGSSEEVAMQVWSSESSSQFRFVEGGVASPAVLFGQASRRARKLGEPEEEVWREKEEATGGRYLP